MANSSYAAPATGAACAVLDAPVSDRVEVTVATPLDALAASRQFAEESRAKSWFHVLSTFALIVGSITGAALLPWWPAKLVCGLFGSLVLVRGFILYHDFQHGSILKKSRLGKVVMNVFGMFSLTPAASWKASHNYHHAHVGDMASSHVGSFPVMSVEQWRKSTKGERFAYRMARHPAIIVLLAYITVFGFSVTIAPLLRKPLKHLDSFGSILLHGGLIASLWYFVGWDAALFGVLIPFFASAALGSYLFYAQHNCEGIKHYETKDWNFHSAALESSSYLKMSRVMHWFTGNIGYHHVHHLNLSIPFYRLPEAMKAIPALQNPVVTTLRPRDLVRSFSLKLWDGSLGRMVTFREARAKSLTVR